MSKSSVHTGYGMIRVGDKTTRLAKNRVNCDGLIDATVNSFINDGGRFNTDRCAIGTSPWFMRFSAKRYDKPNRYMDPDWWASGVYQYWRTAGWDILANGTSARFRRRQPSSVLSVPVDNDGVARVVAIGGMWAGPREGAYNALPGGVPWGQYVYSDGLIPFGFLDVPGVTIGNTFKHQADVPSGRYFYVDTGDNPLSQGDIEFGGHVAYPDNRLMHHVYQVYVTKSGGTGTIDTGVGSQTNGTLTAGGGSDDLFTDAAAGGHFTAGDADGNHYIAIREPGGRNGTYLITSFVDADNVRVDCQQVNEAVGTTETSLDWTLREGPIAEYFWRRTPYYQYDRPSASLHSSYNSPPMHYRGNEISPFIPATSSGNGAPTAMAPDGAGNYWGVHAAMQTSDPDVWKYGLNRYTQCSPQGGDPTYADGDITDMPTGITEWGDLNSDDQHNIWVSWLAAPDAPDADKRLAKIDPYPGGNARYPAVAGSGAALYEAQSSASDASGLCSDKPVGVVCDYENGVTWIFHWAGTRLGTDQDNGGISYTPDHGTTWKRLHRLHTVTGTDTFDVAGDTPVAGQSTVTRNTGSVDLTTVFAVGDWVRYGSDTRSYEISSVTATTLVVEGVHAGGTAQTIQKGALSGDAQALVKHGPWINLENNRNNDLGGGLQSRCAADFDKDGNLYWISEDRNTYCRWSPADGQVVTQSYTDVPNRGYGFYPDVTINLHISRLPLMSGLDAHPFDENIWIAQQRYGGVTRVPKKNFGRFGASFTDVAPTAYADSAVEPGVKTQVTSAAHGLIDGCEIYITGTTSAEYDGEWVISNVTTNTFDIAKVFGTNPAAKGTWTTIVTRYNYNTTNNWPLSVDFPYTESWGSATFTDETCGQIWIAWTYAQGDDRGCYIHMNGDTMGLVTAATINWNSVYYANSHSEKWTSFMPNLAMHFGRDGTSQGMIANMANNIRTYMMRQHHGMWSALGWDGSSWNLMFGNPLGVDLDFDGSDTSPGPHVPDPTNLAVGTGLRRVHEGWEELEHGLNVRFTQNGTVAQTSEFVIDEQTTVPVYIGWGKDNISDAEYKLGYFTSPTVFRQGVEAGGPTANPWTVDGPDFDTMGVDGGWKNGDASVGATPEWNKGVAEPCVYESRDAPFEEFDSTYSNANTRDNSHYMACLRIRPELELDNDGSFTGTTFTSAGGHTFTTADHGKTIEIEGATNPLNNGSYVITAGTGASVTVHTAFNSAEGPTGGLRWKLIDIPAVGYVEVRYRYNDQHRLSMIAHSWRLFSSPDRGQNWTQVKKFLRLDDCTDDEDLKPTYQDDDIRVGHVIYDSGDQVGRGTSMVFDLTALSETERRRTYWKIFFEYGGLSQNLRHSCVILRDNDYKILGAPSYLKCADADDPQFISSWIGSDSDNSMTRKLTLHDAGTDQLQTVDDGNGDGYTNQLQLTAGTLYQVNGTNGDTTGGANKFDAASAATATGSLIVADGDGVMTLTVTAATFTRHHVGKLLNIAGATGGNNGTFHILEFVSSTSVKYFNNQGAGEIYSGTVTLYPFSELDVGKKIRIPGATPSGGGDYNGWVTITAVDSLTRVTIDIELTDTTGLTWALCSFGPGDLVFFDDDYLLPVEYAEARDLLAVIDDVPTATTIDLVSDVVPLVSPFTVAVDFEILRSFPDGVQLIRPGYSTTFPTAYEGYFTARAGVYYHSYLCEFLELSTSPVTGCSTDVDNDGDGRTDLLIVPGDISGSGIGQVVPGDYVEVSGTGIGTRTFEIKKMAWSSPNTGVFVYLDELPPSLTGLTVKLLRRRWWGARTLKSTTITEETIS